MLLFHIRTEFCFSLIILVNRGWIPEKYKESSTGILDQIKDVQELTGVIRLTEKRPLFVPKNKPNENIWFYRYVLLFTF